MARFEYFVDTRRRDRRPRAVGKAAELQAEAIASEWRPAPLGRLGRMLWSDIDHYLEFVAIARQPDEPRADRTTTKTGTSFVVTY
jgi:hypothetical protein